MEENLAKGIHKNIPCCFNQKKENDDMIKTGDVVYINEPLKTAKICKYLRPMTNDTCLVMDGKGIRRIVKTDNVFKSKKDAQTAALLKLLT